MEQTKLTRDDLKEMLEFDDSIHMILATDPDNIDDQTIAAKWHAAIDIIRELDAALYS